MRPPFNKRFGLGCVALLALALMALGVLGSGESPPNFIAHKEARPVAELRFADADGRARTLADFRGKVVLLNVWATWCAPCRSEMPTLDRLQATLGGPDFEVVALSSDHAGLDRVRKFYVETGLRDVALYFDSSGKAQRDLGVVGLPTTLLIDRDGREVGRLVGPAEWDAPEMVAFLRARIEPRRSNEPSIKPEEPRLGR